MKKFMAIILVLVLSILTAEVLGAESQDFLVKIVEGDVKTVKAMLDKNPDLVNQKSDDGSTPIHIAAGGDNVEMVELFLKAGAEVQVFDNIRTRRRASTEQVMVLARENGATVIEVENILINSPEKEAFLALDSIHMREPYHKLMAREWIRYLCGARPAALENPENKTPQ